MAGVKTTTLPAVLKEYLPEYEPPTPGRAVKGGQERGDKEVAKTEGGKPEEKSPRETHGGGHKKGEGDHHKSKPRKSARSRPPTRERTSDYLRKQESEKYERNYQTWQQIKIDVREEGKERGLERIKLQHELIKAQDELHQENVAKRDEEQAKKREAEKAAKKARAEELQRIGRESFGGENRRSRAGSPKRRARTLTETSVVTESVASKDENVLITEQQAHERGISQGGTSESSTTHAHPFGLPSTPASALAEEDEPDESTISESRPVSKAVPWHHEQLYRLYGKQADYFLYPKFEPEKKKMVGPMNPNIRREGVTQDGTVTSINEGRAGARALWNILRDESNVKLLEQDRQIPEELKFAYGAFVRQSLQHKRKPVKRNYYAQEDVPEMERLLDQSQVQNAQEYRHKVEIMFRSSHINEDRAKVLMFNNPIPNVNNREGEESCGRYMPSWLDTDSWDAESELSYKKWLRAQARKLEEDEETPDTPNENVVPLDQTSTNNQWDFIGMKRKPKDSDKLPKLQFLTEKAATVKGQFSHRRKAALEQKDVPKAFDGPVVKKSHSAMAMLGAGDGEDQSSNRTVSVSGSDRKSVPRSHSEMSHGAYMSSWQPLSMQALAEYRPEQQALGQGDYSQGRTIVWKPGVKAE